MRTHVHGRSGDVASIAPTLRTVVLAALYSMACHACSPAGLGGGKGAPVPDVAAAPVINPGTRASDVSITATVSCSSPGSLPYLTTDGSTPTVSSTQSASATFTTSGTLTAICAGGGYTTSPAVSATYTINGVLVAAAPAITPGTSSSSNPITATVTCSSAGSVPYLTTDGSMPTTSSSQRASATFTTSGTLKAICAGGGFAPSPVSSATYTINGVLVAAAPVITPGTSSSSSPITATITCSSAGTLPYRTTDGTTPTSSSTQSGTATFAASGTLKAICAGGSFAPSPVSSATYTIGPPVAAAPVLTPPSGSSENPITVTIACASAGTLPYRTTDGSTPTASSTQSASATFTKTGTLKAICAGGGFSPSPVATGTYWIGSAGPGPIGNWYADGDDDGVNDDVDNCPQAYNPHQEDANKNGVGDICEPSLKPVQNGAIVDLHAEHVTPYGAWFSFTSPRTAQNYWEAELMWSRNAADLATINTATAKALLDAGQAASVRVQESFGLERLAPYILTSLEPDTTYYFAIVPIEWNGAVSTPGSNLVEIHTAPAPSVVPPSTHPHVSVTPAMLTSLQARYKAGDAALLEWESLLGPQAISAGNGGPGAPYAGQLYCSTAGLLYLITGKTAYRDAGLKLVDQSITRWEGGFDGNNYRWEEAGLGRCLDVMWNELPAATRERALVAMMNAAEAAINGGAGMADTDEFASQPRTFIIDGLDGCGSTGITPALQQRACAVLKEGLRRVFGVQAVKMRRDHGIYAKSGGTFPDGIEYAHNTSSYWMQTFYVLGNNGVNPANFAPYALRNFLGMNLYPLTPRGIAWVTWGDVQDRDSPSEPGSFVPRPAYPSMTGWQMAILAQAGLSKEAGWVRKQMYEMYQPSAGNDRDPLLLFDSSSLATVDYRAELSKTYVDKGMGILFDRTSWNTSASYFYFSSGWAAVDHVHSDAGHFQLYRRGRWITHEGVGYDAPAATVVGHNVLGLPIADTSDGQYALALTGHARLGRTSSTAEYTFAHGDTTGAYEARNTPTYDQAGRRVFWLKSNDGAGADTVVVFDRVEANGNLSGNVSPSVRFHFDVAPTIAGRTATLSLPASPASQDVRLEIVMPATATLSAELPDTSGNYGSVTTHRVLVTPHVTGRSLRMVSVLRAADAGTSLAAAVALQGTGVTGALVGNQVFAVAEAESVSIPVSNAGGIRVHVAGLTPARTYTVRMIAGPAVEVLPGTGIAATSAGVVDATIDSGGGVTP